MKFQIITNNISVFEKYKNEYDIKYYDISYCEILNKVHYMVEEGYKLLSHPLSGSVKPNETPFKSIMLTQNKNIVDLESLTIIENALITYNKFIQNKKEYDQSVIKDFQYVDFALIKSAIDAANENSL